MRNLLNERKRCKMKYVLKGVSSVEESQTPNYMGDLTNYGVTLEFSSMKEAIKYVKENDGFVINEEEDFAFVVRNITRLKD